MIMTITKLSRLILGGVLVTTLVGSSFAIFAKSGAPDQSDQSIFVSQGQNEQDSSAQPANLPTDQKDADAKAQVIGQTQSDNNTTTPDKVTNYDQN